MHHFYNIQLAINFTEKEFHEMYDELFPYPYQIGTSYFDRLFKETPACRLFPREVQDLILKERYSDKKMKNLLAPYKLDNILPGVWVWEDKKMVKIDVSEIWNNLEVYVNTYTTTSYSTN